MRIKTIQLSWFRGAADQVSLDLDCKSMVVYGENGSGKSSFVDAVEYVLNNGRIGHLAHEYSGKSQERAIPNTHKPPDRETGLRFTFKDNSELKTEIKPDGSSTSLGADAVAMSTWDYWRTVLRQHEVATFIHATKGEKYSALLPLLGLDKMEIAAENLRQLAKAVEQQSNLGEVKVILKQSEERQKKTFGKASDDQILRMIEDLHSKYCPDRPTTKDLFSRCQEVETAQKFQIERFSADQRRHLAFQGAAEVNLKELVDAVRAASLRLADEAEPLIYEKLEVLESVGSFVDKLEEEKEVKCPACGQSIPADAFQAHVSSERERLKEIIDIFDTRKVAMVTLSDAVKSLKSNLGKPDLQSWRSDLTKGTLADNYKYLEGLNAEVLRKSCGEEDLKAIETKLQPVIDVAVSASKDVPPEIQQITTDKHTIEVGKDVFEAKKQAVAAARAEALVSFIKSLEQSIRTEIRLRSQTVIDEISTDIQAMWAILHPGEKIEGVRLYVPKDADKAIDIGLKFHGVEQESPRLTLSEGYRNSLGLCIFLALAKREADNDRPLFLDDVVVSLDRNHRGMILELLEKEFSRRQVVILTHDREWYTELRQQLDGKGWSFKTLLPYEAPDIGIRWSHKTTTFDDARAHLKQRPDSAGNDARKIMDVELALVAERLQIRMPFLRGDKNDKRMAHDFLRRIVKEGKSCFQKRDGKVYMSHMEAIEMLDNADRLLISWANRASHTFDLVRQEAIKLIDSCEMALQFFKCPSCYKSVWFADAAGSEWVQCQCGQIRWRYGKG